MKFGVLNRKGDQLEDDIFNNEEGSAQFYEFLSLIGEKVTLSSHTGFSGGLDRCSGALQSYATAFCGYEIMFHVAPLLPFHKNDAIQLDRKRHIGNDMCIIVFNEDGEDGTAAGPVPAALLRSQFTNVVLVVNPVYEDQVVREEEGGDHKENAETLESIREEHEQEEAGVVRNEKEMTIENYEESGQEGKMKSEVSKTESESENRSSELNNKKEENDEKKNYKERKGAVVGYRLRVCARECTPAFGPQLPDVTRMFPKDKAKELRACILSKLINGELSTYRHDDFVHKTKKARRDMLQLLYDRYTKKEHTREKE
jgi:hypothetical protein